LKDLSEVLQARLQERSCGLSWQDQYFPYAELIEEARHQAASFPEPGHTVVLISDNSLHLVQALLAAWWAGCTPVCLPPPARMVQMGPYSDFLQNALSQVNAGPGWCDPKLLSRLPPGWRGLPLERGPQPIPQRPPAPLAYLQFSSGTTLTPTATRLSHANLIHNLEAIVSQLPGSRTRHSCVSWLPLYHDMGLVGCLLSALYAPGSLHLMTPTQFALRPGSWLDAIGQHRASISAAPNFALEQLLLRDTGTRDLSSLEWLLLGAETVKDDTLRRFYQKYADQGLRWQALRPVYGLAEATLAVTFSDRPRLESFQIPTEIGERVTRGSRPLVSVGRALPGVQLSVRDQVGQPLPEGCMGLIHVAGPSLACHLPAPYNTGDIGFLWENQLYFVSRYKDVIVYQGRKHDPEVVEALVAPLESAAINSAEEQVVCVVERPRRQADQDPSLMLELAQFLSQAPMPVRPMVVDTGWLPRTSSGKVSRFRARQKLDRESPHVAL
jgi:acyl-CoA synthetase (AMP-forming)/AMP-acid ligase II